MHPSIDKEKQNVARKYFYTKYLISKAGSLATLFFLILIIFSGMSGYISTSIKAYTENTILYRTIYFFIFFFILFGISFPFSYILSYRIEHKYNFSNQNIKAWLFDQLKGFLVSLILGLIVVNIFYLIVNYFPSLWWLFTGVFLLIFSVLLQHLAPVLLMPIFYKFEPLEDDTLKDKLLALAEKVRIPVIGVFNIKLSQKTKKANAALAGLGSTRRMLLGDTLLENYEHGEIETVIAHELAHHIHKHIQKLILLGGFMTFLKMYILYLTLPPILSYLNLGLLTDITSFPGLILVASFFSFITSPLLSHISRKLETQADDTAIELSEKPEEFISTMAKFANNYLSFAYPPKWLEWLEYDHPSIGNRIERAAQAINSK